MSYEVIARRTGLQSCNGGIDDLPPSSQLPLNDRRLPGAQPLRPLLRNRTLRNPANPDAPLIRRDTEPRPEDAALLDDRTPVLILRQRFLRPGPSHPLQHPAIEHERVRRRPSEEPCPASCRVLKTGLQGERKQKADSALGELVAKHDEFSGLTIYTSPDAPIGSVRNYFGVYLVTQPEDAPRVVWRFMTTGPDWLFAKRVWINRDGTVLPPIELPVSDMNRDNTHDKTWEWYEDVLTTDQEIATMMGLATGQKVLLRIEGEQYVRTRELDDREKRAIIQVLNVYAKLLMVSRS
jgi:hypothetical protein